MSFMIDPCKKAFLQPMDREKVTEIRTAIVIFTEMVRVA